MRVPRGFNSHRDRLKTGNGSRFIRLSDGRITRALVVTLSSGEREVLITNPDKGEEEDTAFPELYCKQWLVETNYS
jgi:hypothetical protein